MKTPYNFDCGEPIYVGDYILIEVFFGDQVAKVLFENDAFIVEYSRKNGTKGKLSEIFDNLEAGDQFRKLDRNVWDKLWEVK